MSEDLDKVFGDLCAEIMAKSRTDGIPVALTSHINQERARRGLAPVEWWPDGVDYHTLISKP